jgi:serine-type D-Ala-D-Ala carboxypeptidase/endopeptidase (penicillin-binding protein 4)
MRPVWINYIALLLIMYSAAFAQSKYANLSKAVQQAVQAPGLKYGQWSMYAQNIKSGKVLVNINSETGLAPASNLKVVTAAAALELLGEDFMFSTCLEYDGVITPGGKLQGNIYIRGEGDPTLGSAEMNGVLPLDSLLEQWVIRIRNLGIQYITGTIIADDSFLDYMPTPGSWFWTDIGNYYGAGTSGLCIHENLYFLFFKPGEKAGAPAQVLRTEPSVPGLRFINHMRTGKTGSGDNGYIYHAPWQWEQQLEGTIPAGVDEFSIKGSLPDPAKFAAQYLKEKLKTAGIPVEGEPLTLRETTNGTNQRTLFHITVSPPLRDIIYRLNKKSVNIYAEQLLKVMGKKIKNNASLDSSLQVVQNWLQDNGISTAGLHLHDGSGLSWLNRITTLSFVQLLTNILDKPYFEAFYNSLPIAGDSTDDGTMRNMCRGTRAAGNLRAKTGGIERVSTHTGYVRTRKGDLVCFSMMANNFDGADRTIRSLHEKIMIQLAELP